MPSRLAFLHGALLSVLALAMAGPTWGQGKPVAPPHRHDLYGDPLPAEATKRLGTLRFRNADGFMSVAFTPDGSYLVTGGWNGPRMWDAKTGLLVRRFGEELHILWEPAALSPDGKSVAVGGYGETGGAVFEIASGRQLYRFGSPKVTTSCCFSPDGKMLAVYPRDHGAIVLLDAATGKELRNLKGHGRGAGLDNVHLAFSSDSRTLVSAGGDGAIRVWDTRNEKELRRIDAHVDGFAKFALAPNGELVATAPYRVIPVNNGRNFFTSPEVFLWHTQSLKELHHSDVGTATTKKDNLNGPNFVSFSPDSTELLTDDRDGAIRIWDVTTGKELRRFDHDAGTFAVGFGPRNTLAVIEGHSLRLRDFSTGRDLAPTGGHRRPIDYAVVSPNGRTIVTCARYERSIILWDAATGRELRRLTGQFRDFACPVFSPDGATLFARGSIDQLCTWDPATGQELRRFKLKDHGLILRMSPDGSTLATCGWKSIALLDAANGTEIRTWPADGERIADFDFTPDGKALLAWATGGQLRRWDLPTGEHTMRDFYDVDAYPFSVVFSPNGRLVAFGVQYSDVLPVVDVATGREVCRFSLTPTEPAQHVAWVAFSPDSRTVAWGGREDGSVWLGELATGRVRHQLAGHRGSVQSLAWSRDGKTLLTGSADTTALVWKLTGPLPGDGAGAPLTAADLNVAWSAVGEHDGRKAYAAVRRLAADPLRAIDMFSQRLTPVAEAGPRRLAELLGQLASESFAAREQATRELQMLGERALTALRQRLDAKPTLEEARRLGRLIKQIETLTPERIQAIRAVEALEHMNTQESRQLLRRLAKGTTGARLSREARESLARLEARDGP